MGIVIHPLNPLARNTSTARAAVRSRLAVRDNVDDIRALGRDGARRARGRGVGKLERAKVGEVLLAKLLDDPLGVGEAQRVHRVGAVVRGALARRQVRSSRQRLNCYVASSVSSSTFMLHLYGLDR